MSTQATPASNNTTSPRETATSQHASNNTPAPVGKTSTTASSTTPASNNTSTPADKTETTGSSTSVNKDKDNSNTAPEEGYPEQMHTGKVGIGPNYHQGPTFNEKLTGVKEELKGKLTHNSDLAHKGHDRKTGELKRKEKEDKDPFQVPDEDEDKNKDSATDKKDGESKKEDQDKNDTGYEMHHEKIRAATVAPEGTHAGEKQSRGEAGDGMKHIG